MKVGCVVVAAGAGVRAKKRINKVFYEVSGRPVVWYTLAPFRQGKEVSFIVLVVSYRDFQAGLVDERKAQEMGADVLVFGGATRAESVRAGIASLPSDCSLVLVHDGARPFVTESEIKRVLESAKNYGAAVLSIPVFDTLKRADDGFVSKTVSRRGLFRALTPQAFTREIIERAYAQDFDSHEVTDDSQIVERLGVPVALCEGRTTNLKITTEEDLRLAELVLPFWKGEG
ncbi:MAG: 2-C-methyl-D-erythritol 4-phosphate cytidylyltransferase [Planctomycetota bacterium]|nr:2-C-methyl-D-erythritol 4-phosphate cytidylyltransferase [Planctomycetota bacterium]